MKKMRGRRKTTRGCKGERKSGGEEKREKEEENKKIVTRKGKRERRRRRRRIRRREEIDPLPLCSPGEHAARDRFSFTPMRC